MPTEVTLDANEQKPADKVHYYISTMGKRPVTRVVTYVDGAENGQAYLYTGDKGIEISKEMIDRHLEDGIWKEVPLHGVPPMKPKKQKSTKSKHAN